MDISACPCIQQSLFGTVCCSVFIAMPGSWCMHALHQFAETINDFPHFLREGGPRITRLGALLAQRWFGSGYTFCVSLDALEFLLFPLISGLGS